MLLSCDESELHSSYFVSYEEVNQIEDEIENIED